MSSYPATSPHRAILHVFGLPLLCLSIGFALLAGVDIATAQTIESITGRIVLATSGEAPVTASVYAFDMAGNQVAHEFINDTGHYTFTELPPGDYIIRFGNGVWVNQYYDNRTIFEEAIPVTVVTNAVSSEINATLVSRKSTELVVATASTRPDAILAARERNFGPIFTLDGGQTWQPFTTLPYAVDFDPPQIALIPKDDSAQPIRFLVGPTDGVTRADDGLHRSGDVGVSWARFIPQDDPRCAPSSPHIVEKLATSPTDPQRVYAVTRCTNTRIVIEPVTDLFRTLYTSSDGGVSWQRVTMPPGRTGYAAPPLITLQPSPAAPTRLYAQYDGVHRLHWQRSDDYAQTWITETFTMTALAWDWTDAAKLYGVEDSEFPPELGVTENAFRYLGKRSDNQGASWSDWAEQPCRTSFRQLLALPTTNTLLLLCDQGLLRSIDGGDSWTLLTTESDGTLATHSGDHAVTLWARGSELWVSSDQGTSWTRLGGWRDVHLPSVHGPD